jgi:hypothetical protein
VIQARWVQTRHPDARVDCDPVAPRETPRGRAHDAEREHLGAAASIRLSAERDALASSRSIVALARAIQVTVVGGWALHNRPAAMSSGGRWGLRNTTTERPGTMLTPTVTELLRTLEAVGRDPFIDGRDNAPAGRARITLVASEPATIGGAPQLVRSLAA